MLGWWKERMEKRRVLGVGASIWWRSQREKGLRARLGMIVFVCVKLVRGREVRTCVLEMFAALHGFSRAGEDGSVGGRDRK